jgi:hypothetical protein
MSDQHPGNRIHHAADHRAYMKEARETVKKGSEGYTMVTRAKVSLIRDQLKEARVGEYIIKSDEHRARGGGGEGPAPLQYFIAAIGF